MRKPAGSAFLLLILFLSVITGAFISSCSHVGSLKDPVIDSNMSETEAFDGLNPECPDEIIKRQKIVMVRYYSFDRRIHQGQIIIDADLENDIRTVFEEALKLGFPVCSVIPVSDKRFRKDGRWDDELSMEANNTSAFNYRFITGSSTRISKHAHGRAIDINPVQNPYIKENTVLPKGAEYAPDIDGTLTGDHPVVRTFLRLGWEWGGNWTSRKDYQHFEKPLHKPD